MSIPINQDTSTQPTLTFTTVSTPETLNIWQRSGTNIYNTDTGNVGIGTTTNINFKLKVNGTVNATAFNGDGANITNVPYSTITGKPTNFQADWLTTIINKPTNFQSDWTSTIINKPSTFPADMTNIYTKTETNNLLSAKEATLTFTSPLTRTTNTISFSESAITTLTNFYNKTDADNRYLQLSGGTLTGNLNVNANITTQQLYINNQNSTASIIFSPNPSIYSIFSRKVPWAMYFAEDFNSASPTVLPNYISNSRDATLSGTIAKTTGSGNGATGNITYISGGTGATISFPAGSIPETFTILSLTRYTGGVRGRILQARQTLNWLHGHHLNKRGVCYYNNGWKTNESTTGNIDDWLCFIGKNVGATPGNILADGATRGVASGGDGNSSVQLAINLGFNELSDWALSCVMIWNTALTDAEMQDLNTIINTYRNDGVSIKSLISSTIDDDSIIESRIYNGLEKTELLLFKGNDGTGANGADRIRLKAGNIAFDTYSSLTPSSSRNNENIVMLINENGNVGIGTTTNLTSKLNINGSLNATSLSGDGANITNVPYSTITGKPTNFQADWTTTIINKPTNFQADWTTTIINKPTNFQADWNTTIINKPTNFQADWNTTIINKPTNFQADWTTTIINKPATFPPTMTNIYTKAETDNLLSAKEATLTFTSPLTRTTNTISFSESAITTLTNFYNKNDADNRYLKLSGGSLTGNVYGNDILLSVNKGSFNRIDTLKTANVNVPGVGEEGPLTGGEKILLGPGTPTTHPYSIGLNTNVQWYSVPTGATQIFYVGGTAITTISSTGLTTTGFINATTNLQENGTNLTSKYLQLSGGTLTGKLTINVSYPEVQLGATNGNNFGISTAAGGFSSSASAGDMVLRSINNLLILSGSDAPAIYINTANNVGIGTTTNLTYKLNVNGSINSTSLWQNGTQIDFNSYLLKSGGTMTGQLILSFNDNPLRIKSTLSGANNCIQILNNIDKTAYIGIAGSTFGGNYQNNFFIESATGSIILNTSGRTSLSVPNMIISDTGNVGIGTTNPNTLLDIYNASNPKIYLNVAGNTRCFLSGLSGGLDLGNDVGTGKYIRLMPDNVEKVRIKSDGNVGIGTTDPKCKLQVFGAVNFCNSSTVLNTNNYMQAGSLTIGDVLLNYGGGNNWNTNTAGLMFECANNTEMAVHDSATRLASLMYYEGGTNKITIGRDMGWGNISSVVINGALVAPTQVRSPLLTATQNSTGYANGIYGTAFNGWYIDLNTFWSGNAGNGGPAYLTLCFCFSQNTNIKWYGRVMVNSGGGTFGLITDLKNPTSGPTMINISNEWGTNGQNFLYISQAVMDNTYTLIYKIIG